MTEMTTPIFDWEKFKTGNIAVHCDTKAKAKIFVKMCFENGIPWAGDSKRTKTCYSDNKKDTCYSRHPWFQELFLSYLDIKYHQGKNNTIIEFPFEPEAPQPVKQEGA